MPPVPQRGIDHIVFAVNDLDASLSLFKRLGFTTMPRADHRSRTCDSVVQLQGNYIELFAVTDPAKVLAAGPGRFNFGRFNAEFLQRREGMTMLVFASDDARRDLAEFAAAGLTTHGPMDFTGNATLPDGSQKEVPFSLAFVTDERTPDAVYFVCQLHAPENYWRPEYQRHANTAHQVAEVVMVANKPAELASLFGGLQRPQQVRIEAGGLRVETARGQVTVLTPAAFTERYPGTVPVARGPYFAAVRVTVRDLATAHGILRAAGIPARGSPGRLWLEPQWAGGVLLELTH